MAEAAKRIGDVLGGAYKLERVIGRGGMGLVYEASHTRLPKRFAVKMLEADIAEKPELFERFRREAEIVSALGHENIVGVVDFNHAESGTPYMVLELLEGEDLGDRIARRGRLPVDETVAIAEQVASGLAAAHEKGIVHRDLKPKNIFLVPRDGGGDQVKILDFGISKIVHATTQATRTGTILGTPNYMSPEQAEGKSDEVDERTDVFALGAIVYECLTGTKAFEGSSMLGTLYHVCNKPATPVRELVPELPAAIERVVDCALIKRRRARYQSVEELCRELVAAARGEPVEAPRATAVAAAPAGATVTEVRHPAAGAHAADDSDELAAGDTVAATSTIAGRRRRAAFAAAGGVAAGALALVFVLGGGGGDDRVSSSAAPVPAAPVDAASPAATAAPDSDADARPGRAIVIVQVAPADAEILVDGEVREGPELTFEDGSGPHTIELRAPGHVPLRREVAPSAERVTILNAELAPVDDPAPPRARRPARRADPPPPPPDDEPKPPPGRGIYDREL